MSRPYRNNQGRISNPQGGRYSSRTSYGYQNNYYNNNQQNQQYEHYEGYDQYGNPYHNNYYNNQNNNQNYYSNNYSQSQYSRQSFPRENQPYIRNQPNTNQYNIRNNPTYDRHVSPTLPQQSLNKHQFQQPQNHIDEKRKNFTNTNNNSNSNSNNIIVPLTSKTPVKESLININSPNENSTLLENSPSIIQSETNDSELKNVNNLVLNNKLIEKQNKALQWMSKKLNKDNNSIKKKSLMNFKKKSNKINIAKAIKIAKPSAFEEIDTDKVEEEKEEEEKEEKIPYHPINFEFNEDEIEDKAEDENASTNDISPGNNTHLDSEEKEKEEDDDEDDDLDMLLSTLEKDGDKLKPKLIVEDVNSADSFTSEDNGSADEAEKLLTILGGKNKKEVPEHEFSTIPFNKKFYKESEFIKTLTNNEVKILRENDSVHIKGKNIIKPILEWSQLGLPVSIFSVLTNLKFDSPTPIQCEALPHIMNGNDFIGIAQTGSGKTIAFLLPLFRQLLSNNSEDKEQHQEHNKFLGATPKAIIITPTRELALQIAKTAKPFADRLNMNICKCYGGQSISKQISELKKQTDIIVGTPGRIIDLLCTNSGRILKLSQITYLVMDEADRMFDMGFEPQVLKILKVIRPDRQTVLFSATFPPKIQNLARKILNNPIEVLIGSKNLVNENITQNFEIVSKEDDGKFNKLLQILGLKYKENEGKVLIFMERQDSCDSMVKKLLSRGYAVMSLHGGKDQTERGGTIKDFKKGIIDIIVATSVAARGLDVDNLNLVINYDAPSHIEDYVHRVGRTGRGGNKGESYTILTPDEEKAAFDLVKILNAAKLDIPVKLKEMSDNFQDKIKQGDVKFGSGFGGKGLEKLQAIREKNENIEKQVYLKEDDKNGTENGESNNNNKLSSIDNNKFDIDVLKNFKVEYTTETKFEATAYSAKLNVNDLPQDTRRFVTTHENIMNIIEMTGTSITTRGRYYPPGQDVKPGGDAKLHILVEGPDEICVGKAVSLFRERVLAGLERETSAATDA